MFGLRGHPGFSSVDVLRPTVARSRRRSPPQLGRRSQRGRTPLGSPGCAALASAGALLEHGLTSLDLCHAHDPPPLISTCHVGRLPSLATFTTLGPPDFEYVSRESSRRPPPTEGDVPEPPQDAVMCVTLRWCRECPGQPARSAASRRPGVR